MSSGPADNVSADHPKCNWQRARSLAGPLKERLCPAAACQKAKLAFLAAIPPTLSRPQPSSRRSGGDWLSGRAYPAGNGSNSIRRTIDANNRRVR
jgi:hypothetical protein